MRTSGPKKSRLAVLWDRSVGKLSESMDRRTPAQTGESLGGDVATLVAGVRAAGFREKLRGYDPVDVDALLNDIAVELEAGRPVGRLIKEATFNDKLRGYHPDDVDVFLERIRAAAARLGGS